MQKKGELGRQHEMLRFESSNKNILSQFMILQNGILICYFYGYADLKSVEESYRHFSGLLTKLTGDGINPPFDMVIDFNNVRWIDKKARSYLNKTAIELFETGALRHIGVISSNYFAKTLGAVWSRFSPWMDYRFYKNELAAYEDILKKRVSSAVHSTEDALAQDLHKENIISYKGKKLMLYRRKEWQCQDPEMQVFSILINSRILYLQIKGDLTAAGVDKILTVSKDAHDLLNEKLILILDVSELGFPATSIRNYWFSRMGETNAMWGFTFIVGNQMISALYKILQASQKDLVERTIFDKKPHRAIEKALHILSLNDKYPFIQSQSKAVEPDYSSWSKRRLMQELDFVRRNQNKRIQQLFDVFSRISWGKNYQPLELNIPQTDPFYDLFSAANVVQHDISETTVELKELNQNLEEKVKERTSLLKSKNDELTLLNDELDHFVYSVSHDLRAPLTSIQGLINLMKMEQDNKMHGQYLDLVTKNIKRLDLFIQEILHLSRNARLAVEKGPIDFQKIIDNTFSELVYLTASGSIQKNIYLEQDTIFYSDSHRIIIIFRNLLSNAIKYSSGPYNTPYVNIRIKVTREFAFLEVEDNGMGIMEEHIHRVFDMFYRATDNNAGSGLGLYIVKQVISKLDGRIDLASTVGKGTKISITLPNLCIPAEISGQCEKSGLV